MECRRFSRKSSRQFTAPPEPTPAPSPSPIPPPSSGGGGGILPPPPSPEEASYPNPPNGSSNIPTTPTLTWVPGQGATAHDLYFGYTNPPPLRASQLPTPLYQLPELARGITYYWRVAEWNAFGITVGPIWSFTTEGATVTPPPPPPPPASSGTTSGINITRTLSIGSRGDDVKELQLYLQKLGHFPASETPTGYFGLITQASVQKYQCAVLPLCSGSPSSNGYGVVGPRTRAALHGSLAVTPPTSSSIFTRSLSIGISGDDVRELQVRLRSLGYFPASEEPTGYYGRITEAAVQKFQCEKIAICNGSPVENGYGVFGPRTRTALLAQ